MAEIQIKNISKSFGDTKVLDKISFQVQDGHFLSLLGPSGCGKTTLLRIIAGLEYADEGAVLVGEAEHRRCVPELCADSAYDGLQ